MSSEITLWILIFGGNAALVCIMEGGQIAKYTVTVLGVASFIAGFFSSMLWLLAAIFAVSYLAIVRRMSKKPSSKSKK